jgi:hypothetical protein
MFAFVLTIPIILALVIDYTTAMSIDMNTIIVGPYLSWLNISLCICAKAYE